MQVTHRTPYITQLHVPFYSITTSVFLVKTEQGNLLFDTATYPTDVTELILPTLQKLGVERDSLTHVFLSHPHGDHAGGLPTLLDACPHLNVIAGSEALRSVCGDAPYTVAKDEDTLLDVLRVVSLPGHTADSIALLDTRTNTLLSGDGLQLYGIFGAGWWGANIPCPRAHLAALDRLAEMDLDVIYPAHAYHPLTDAYVGREEIQKALALCREPLFLIRERILAKPDATDEELCEDYNRQNLPKVGVHVFAAIRREML